MLARLLVLSAVAVATPAAARPPLVVAPPAAASSAPSSCETLTPEGALTTIGCRLTLQREPADHAVLVRIELARPDRPCTAAMVLELGASPRSAVPIVEEGARKSARPCQP